MQGIEEDEVRVSSDIDIEVHVIGVDISEIGVHFFKPVLPYLMATHDEDIIGFQFTLYIGVWLIASSRGGGYGRFHFFYVGF